jgi:hypothetical protein
MTIRTQGMVTSKHDFKSAQRVEVRKKKARDADRRLRTQEAGRERGQVDDGLCSSEE